MVSLGHGDMEGVSLSTVPIEHLRIVTSLKLVVVTIFFYDWVLTLGDEIELVWRHKSLGRQTLFLTLRYSAFALFCYVISGLASSDNSTRVRQNHGTVRIVGIGVIIVQVQVILQLRVYAMYNRSRAVWVTNAALFVVEWVVVLATYAKTSKGIHYLPYDVKCGLCDSRPKTLGYCYLPMLAYEFYLCALAMWKTFADRKHLAIGKNTILGVLVRDSVAYFLFVSSGLALSVTLFFAIPGVSQ